MKTFADKIDDDLFRILIPFEDLNTTVYVAIYDRGVALIDSGTYPSDADNYILPALSELCIDADRVKYLLLTHRHGDHAGGVRRLAELFPKASVGFISQVGVQGEEQLADGQILLGGLQVVRLPGHTKDSLGYLDIKTATLLSGDSLQLKGVGKYRNGIGYPELYTESVNKLMKMKLRRIVAAHEYDPLGSLADGEAEVERYLTACLAAIKDPL